jgi:hypothetical protein
VVKLTYEDLNTTAAVTKTMPILPVAGTYPAGTMMECIGLIIVTPFIGAALSALTLQVGDGTDPDRLCTAALANLLVGGYSAMPRSVGTQPFVFASADTIDALVTATGANLTALTAGEVAILLRIIDMAEWIRVPR